MGPQVEEYLEAAGVAPGNPWCASFVTWALEKAGHKMPGGGWAGVATWVRNAEQGGNGLKLVSAEEARPGDIVAYDWGGQDDFGADGHIGFLDSDVKDGQFTALEGNNADAVNAVPRRVGDAERRLHPRRGRRAGRRRAGRARRRGRRRRRGARRAGRPRGGRGAGRRPKRASGLFAAVAGAVGRRVGQGGRRARKPSTDSGLFGAIGAEPAAQPARTAGAPLAPEVAGAPAAPPVDVAAAGARGLSRRRRAQAADRRLDGGRGEEARAPRPAAGDGLPGRVQPDQRRLRRRRLARLLPDARLDLGTRLPRLRQGPRETARLVPRHRRSASRPNASNAARAIDDPNQFGEWIADVERPAEQYRGRYQLRLDEANSLLADAPNTPTAPAAPEVAGAPAAPEVAAQPAAPAADQVADAAAPPAMAQGAGPKALAALKEAEKYTGTPYKWGGSTPQTGFDCSGLVQWAYAQAGVQIPRVTDQQIEAASGTTVRRGELLPGDLVFFRDAGGYVHHVGISMGGDKFLHAPHTGDVVKVSSLDEPYYKAQFTGGRRFDAPAVGRPGRRPRGRARGRGSGSARDRSGRGRLGAGRRRARRGRGAPAEQRPVPGDQRAGGAQPRAARRRRRRPGGGRGRRRRRAGRCAAQRLGDVPAGDHAGAGAAGRRARCPPCRPRRRPRPPPRRRRPIPPPRPLPRSAGPVADVPAPDLSGVPADYPGDDAGQAALAKWLAKQADKAGLPPELPVMAALVESGVKNLNFGDADSVGFFQMRVGIWNKGEYAGYPENPGLQAKWFIDTALAHKKAMLAKGDADFGKDPSSWGEWIADVERPAEQYRGRYQLRLEEARKLLR